MLIKLKSGEIIKLENENYDILANNIKINTGNPIFITLTDYVFVISNIEYITRLKED